MDISAAEVREEKAIHRPPDDPSSLSEIPLTGATGG